MAVTPYSAYQHKNRLGKRTRKLTLETIPEDCCSCTERGRRSISQADAIDTSAYYKLIDIDRDDNNLHALERSEELHHLARLHADRMAHNCVVTHSVLNLSALKELLQSSVVGENVQCGPTVRDIHRTTMDKLKTNRANILDDAFQFYGVAVARGRDGKLYVCHYFR